MISLLKLGRLAKMLSLCTVCAASMVLWGCGGDDDPVADSSSSGLSVAKATCGAGDKPEPDLQGQVSAATRAAGFKGYNCNLQLIAQSKGDGANWQTTEFRDGHSRICAYHGSAAPNVSLPGRNPATLGSPIID